VQEEAIITMAKTLRQPAKLFAVTEESSKLKLKFHKDFVKECETSLNTRFGRIIGRVNGNLKLKASAGLRQLIRGIVDKKGLTDDDIAARALEIVKKQSVGNLRNAFKGALNGNSKVGTGRIFRTY
jgi:hypothetical protein